MALFGPSSSSSTRGPGLEILDDISAAQQYVLDLQVLFYSLKTVASNAQKEANETAAAAKAASSDAGATGTSAVDSSRAGAAATTAALQQQIDDLTQQLENERRERARLQEQYDQAVSMLRKSYGQIVDDYLFATEQLHARTKQLEGFMEATAAVDAARSPAAQSPASTQPARPQPAAATGDAENADDPLLELRGQQKHQRRQQPEQHHAQQRQDDLLLPAPLGSNSAGRGRAAASIGEGTHSTLSEAEAPGGVPRVRGSARTAPDSRSSSQGSCGGGKAGGDAGGMPDGGAAKERLATAAGSGKLSVEQTAPPSSSNHADAGSSSLLGDLRGVSTLNLHPAIGPHPARPQAQSPRAKARLRALYGSAGQGVDTSPLSSPHGDAPAPRASASGQHAGPPQDRADLAAPQHLPTQRGKPASNARSQLDEQTRTAAAAARRGGGTQRQAVAATVSPIDLRRTTADERIPGTSRGAGLRAQAAHEEGNPLAAGPAASSGLGTSWPAAAEALVTPSEASARNPVAASGTFHAASSVRAASLPRAPDQPQRRLPGSLPESDDSSAARSMHGRNGERERARERDGEEALRGRSAAPAAVAEAAEAAAPFAEAWAVAAAALLSESGSRGAAAPRAHAEAGSMAGASAPAEEQRDAAATAAPYASSRAAQQLTARAAASELGSAAAGFSGQHRWDVGASTSHSFAEHRQDHAGQERGEAEEVVVRGGAAARDADGAAGLPSSQHTLTYNGLQRRGRAAQYADCADAAAAAASNGVADGTPQNGAKRLRRSVSSPAEQHNGRAGGTGSVTTAAAALADPAGLDEASAEPDRANAGRRDAPASPSGRRPANRASSRPLPPAEPLGTYRAAVPQVPTATAAAAEELPQRRGPTGPLPRRRSLRFMMSEPTPESAPSSDSPPTHATRGPLYATAAAAVAAADARAAATPPYSSAAPTAARPVAAAAQEHYNRTAAGGASGDDGGTPLGNSARATTRAGAPERGAGGAAAPTSTGAEGAPATPDVRRQEHRSDHAHAGAGAPLDLDEYLFRARVRPAAAADTAVAGRAGGSQVGPGAGAHAREAAGLFETPSRATGSAPAAADVKSSRAAAASTASVRGSPDAAAASGAAAVTGKSGGDSAATTGAAAVTAAATPAGGVNRGSADGGGIDGSFASSGSIEGLASLVRTLRKRLAGMQQDYSIEPDDFTDDYDDGAGPQGDGGDLDVTDGDWRTEDDDDGVYDVYNTYGGGAVDVRGAFLPAGDGDPNGAYAAAAVFSSDDDYDDGPGTSAGQDDGALDDDENDLVYDSHDRLYSGTFGGTGMAAAARRSSGAAKGVAAAADACAAGRPPNGDSGGEGAPRTRAPGGAGAHDSGSFPEFAGTAWYGGSACVDSSSEGTPLGSHEHGAAPGGFGPKGMGGATFWDGDDGSGGGLERGRRPRGSAAAGAGGANLASPGVPRWVGDDARAGPTSLLDAVNAATLGAAGSSRNVSGGSHAAAAVAAAPLHQGGVAVQHDRPAPPSHFNTTTAAWAAGAAGPARPGLGPWAVGSQPDRVPPPDQTSPRKDTGTAYGRAAAAGGGGGGKAAFKWKVSDDVAEAGAGATAAAELDCGGPVGGGPLDTSFPGARWHNAGPAAAAATAGAKGVAAAAGFACAESAQAGPAASAPGVTASNAAAASPQMQNLRSEAMFARIKKQLDELQSSFSQGLGLARGSSEASRAGSSGGGDSSCSDAEHRAAAASAAAAATAAAAAAAAMKADAWRAAERVSGGGGSGSGVAQHEAGDRASGGGARGAGSLCGGAPFSGNDGGVRRGNNFIAVGSISGEAPAGGRVPLREDRAADRVGSGREDGRDAEHHGVGAADTHGGSEAGNASIRKKSAAASMHVGNHGGGGTKPYGIVLHGEGDG